MSNADEDPAQSTEHHDVPSLTLVLPGGLEADQILHGLLESVKAARALQAGRVRFFRRLEADYATSGDRLRQALWRGQALGAEHAAGDFDEQIIEAFDLWRQYEAQVSGPASGDAGAVTPTGAQAFRESSAR